MKHAKKYSLIIIITLLVMIVVGVFIQLNHQKTQYDINPNKVSILSQEAQALVNEKKIKTNLTQEVPFSQAEFYFKSSDFDLAYQQLLTHAMSGNPVAQLEVGFLTEYGLGVKKNEKDAALWYYLAIRNNQYNQQARFRGMIYYFGLDNQTINYKKASIWFRMAAGLSYDQY
ncbi:hypothetical protein L3V79_04985 [Thiotrichales bacterium 19S9-12]|nr:hypothetical protein [Thiotrichales bacterium 19S9-11]MCF6811712.1 hypothetical protein [Thiotrichales bacterium 19S9-12]